MVKEPRQIFFPNISCPCIDYQNFLTKYNSCFNLRLRTYLNERPMYNTYLNWRFTYNSTEYSSLEPDHRCSSRHNLHRRARTCHSTRQIEINCSKFVSCCYCKTTRCCLLIHSLQKRTQNTDMKTYCEAKAIRKTNDQNTCAKLKLWSRASLSSLWNAFQGHNQINGSFLL